jgi:HEAT repeat protein
LKVDQEAAALMAHCTLLYTDEPELKMAKYWLGRIPDKHEQITSLMRALVAPEPEVRRKAAQLLRDRQAPGMAVQLYRVALEDPDSDVRSEAVSSLKSLGPVPAELRDALEEEATNPHTPYRRNAVECLQIFPDKQTIELLYKIANDPEVGKAAINALKAMQTTDSAAALKALGKTTPRAA